MKRIFYIEGKLEHKLIKNLLKEKSETVKLLKEKKHHQFPLTFSCVTISERIFCTGKFPMAVDLGLGDLSPYEG